MSSAVESSASALTIVAPDGIPVISHLTNAHSMSSSTETWSQQLPVTIELLLISVSNVTPTKSAVPVSPNVFVTLLGGASTLASILASIPASTSVEATHAFAYVPPAYSP